MTTKRQAQFVANWIDDLRSGKYQQGEGVLRRREDGKDTFCCLGVSCMRKRGTWGDPNYAGRMAFLIKDAEKATSLGDLFHEWTGLEFTDVDTFDVVPEDPHRKTWKAYSSSSSFEDILINMNDTGKKNFREIANAIMKRANQVYGRGWRKRYGV